jgi:ribosomal subunit interface protein
MRIIIKARKLKLTDDLRIFVEKKFLGLKKFINILKREDEIGKTLAEVFVELERETKHHKGNNIFIVRSRVSLPGRSLVAKAKSDDLFKAVVSARAELKMEIEKYKFKKTDVRRREQRKSSGKDVT